jgi:hypothetical protein
MVKTIHSMGKRLNHKMICLSLDIVIGDCCSWTTMVNDKIWVVDMRRLRTKYSNFGGILRFPLSAKGFP